MTLDWQNSELLEQLERRGVTLEHAQQALEATLQRSTGEAFTVLSLDGLDDYAASWGQPAAVWLILAVVRMIQEILASFSNTRLGVTPPNIVVVVSLEDDQQEIAHQCLTGYQEIYDVLLRTHRKPSSPIWHRRAVTQYFPQLILEVQDEGTPLDDDSLPENSSE